MDYNSITQKKQQLDTHRPLSPNIVDNLAAWFEVELTYSSNAIEGNTLTRAETALVLEKGLTVSGKPLKDHLEAIGHQQAYQFMHQLVTRTTVTLEDILAIHRLILEKIATHAGSFRTIPVRISGSAVVLPNHLKVSSLMIELMDWLKTTPDLHPVERAALAHYKLVTIHPFVDGNGRTARLLMNLLLLQAGYPPAIIRPRDRLKYIQSLEHAQLGGSMVPFHQLIIKAVDRSLDIYLQAVQEQRPKVTGDIGDTLLRIGALAHRTKESVATIRYWTRIGLIEVSQTTAAGYQLYSPQVVKQMQRIRQLQQQRYTLEEIAMMLQEERTQSE